MSRAGDAVAETRRSLATVFRNPALRRLNLAFAGSAIGDWAYATAMVVWVYGVGGVVAVGLWGTVRLILMAVVTPFASIVVDRFPRRAVMVTCDLTRLVLVTVAAVLIWTHAPTALVLVVATVVSLAGTPFRPAIAALLPSLVDTPEELTASNGTTSTLESLAFFVGPAIGGVLLTVASVPVVIVFDALTFLWSAALVWRIVVPSAQPALVSAPTPAGATAGPDAPVAPAEPAAAKPGFLHESMEGFRAIRANRDLLLVTLVYCAQTIVAGASAVFIIAIAVQMTDFGANGVGYLDSALGVGAILGGLVAIGRAAARKVANDFGIGVILWALPLLLVAAWPQAGAAFAAMFVIGFGNPLADVNASTILQRLTPDAVLGRVFGALDAGLIGAMALGTVLMPGLIHVLGLRWSLAVLGAVIGGLVLLTMPRLRTLDRTLGEPEGLALLRRVPLFAPLEPKALELIASQLGRRTVTAGEVVIREGDPGDRFYVVESGRTTASHDGVVLSSQGPGDPFGEIALLHDVPRTATVVADVDSVLVYLERDAFLAAVRRDAEVSGRAEDLVARRIPTY